MAKKKKKNFTGDKIYAKNASWSFDKKVPKTFTKHISKSVPYYLDGHNLICELSDFFLKDKSYCYDLGCSTGTLLNKIKKRHNNKKINFIGIDSIQEMIKQAKKENKNSSIKYFQKDIKNYKLEKSDLIISYFTIQFIKAKDRQKIMDKIYNSLNWGGALILFEKVRASDARFQDIYSQVYNEFKLKNGFTADEIIFKSKSLKGILEPFSDFGNTGLIKRAGFVDYITIFQWMNFKGYLCIK